MKDYTEYRRQLKEECGYDDELIEKHVADSVDADRRISIALKAVDGFSVKAAHDFFDNMKRYVLEWSTVLKSDDE